MLATASGALLRLLLCGVVAHTLTVRVTPFLPLGYLGMETMNFSNVVLLILAMGFFPARALPFGLTGIFRGLQLILPEVLRNHNANPFFSRKCNILAE